MKYQVTEESGWCDAEIMVELYGEVATLAVYRGIICVGRTEQCTLDYHLGFLNYIEEYRDEYLDGFEKAFETWADLIFRISVAKKGHIRLDEETYAMGEREGKLICEAKWKLAAVAMVPDKNHHSLAYLDGYRDTVARWYRA